MPHCNNCGNTERFKHRITGHEVREYNEDDKYDVEVVEEELETFAVACDECGSGDVILD